MLRLVLLAAHVVRQVFLLIAVVLAAVVAFGLVILRVVLGILVQLLVILGIRVLAQLIAVAEFLDDFPDLAGEGALILQIVAERLKVGFQVLVEKILPDAEHVLRALGQVTPGQFLA